MLVLKADGSYQYVVNNSNPAVTALNDGETLTDTFTYRVMDRAGQTSTATLSMVVHGVTDALPPVPPSPPQVPSVPPAIPIVPVAPPPETTATVSAVVVIDRSPPSIGLGTTLDGTGIRDSWSAPATEDNGRSVPRHFEMTVLPGDLPGLVVYRGIADQFSESESVIRFTIPPDAFAHQQEDSEVIFAATLLDGSSLPSWLVFDRTSGTFSGIAPRGFAGELRIKITARDTRGQEAEAIFRLQVTPANRAPQAKLGLRAQLRGVAYLNSNSHGFDLALK